MKKKKKKKTAINMLKCKYIWGKKKKNKKNFPRRGLGILPNRISFF